VINEELEVEITSEFAPGERKISLLKSSSRFSFHWLMMKLSRTR